MTAPVPAAPVVNSVTFDQTAYSPGETITATVAYSPGTQDSTQTFTGVATDSGGLTGQLVVNFVTVIASATTASASDSGGRTWTKVSDSTGVAVFTATA